MKNRVPFAVLAVLVSLPVFSALHAQTCPVGPPENNALPLVVTGAGCGATQPETCLVNSVVTLSIPASYTLQACDSVYWIFGDGNSIPGSSSITHTYTKTGLMQASARVANSLGVAFFYATIPITTSPGCPTSYPPQIAISWIGPTCSSGVPLSACALNQPVTFTVVPTYFNPAPLEACDQVTINFGDGTSASLPGTFTATHSYTSIGRYEPSATLSNDFGSSATFNQTSLVAGNGIVGFTNTYQPDFMEGTTAHVQVTRTPSSGTVSVGYATSDGTAIAGQQYVATSGTLSFADGESTKTIDVPTIDDGVYSGRLTFQLALSGATGAYFIDTPQVMIGITDADIPTISFVDPSYSVMENAGTLNVSLKRTGDPSKIVSFRFSVADSSAHPAISESGYLIFVANEMTKTVTVPVTDDHVYEGLRTAYAQLDSVSGGTVASCCQRIPVYIQDDEPKPVLTLQPLSVPDGNSGTTIANVVASLSGPMADNLIFNWSTADGTAKSPADYARVSFATATIAAGSTSTSLPVTIVGKSVVEPDKSFAVLAQNVFIPPCCNTPSPGVASPSVVSGTVTILNDDLGIIPQDQDVAQGRTASFVISLGLGVNSPQSISLLSSNTGAVRVPSVVSVAAGQRTVTVPIDVVSPGAARISALLPAAFGSATLTAQVSVFEAASLAFTPSRVAVPVGGAATVLVSVLPPLSTPLTLFWTPIDPTVVSVPASLVINPGQSASLTLSGLKLGSTIVATNVGQDHGNTPFDLIVDVVEKLPSIGITGVDPSSGPISGGTLVTVSASNLDSSCSLYFGDVAAAQLTIINSSTAAAITPSHGSGSVDVRLVCGSTSSVLANGFTYIGGRNRSARH